MTWGTFFIDAAASRVYIQPASGFAPASHPVQFARRTNGLQIMGVSNVVIRNLTLQHHAAYSENDPPALQVRTKPFSATDHIVPKNVLIENVTARWNNASGIGLASLNTTVRNVTSSDNGGGGIAQIGPNSVVRDSIFERNGWRWLWGNYYGWTDGALRFNNIYNCTFSNLTVRSNRTKGIWFDTCGGGITVDACTVEDNNDGIAFEICLVIPGQGAYVVKNSAIRGNTVGITSMQTEQVQILDNVIENNGGWQIRSRIDQNRADPIQFYIYANNDPAQRQLVSYGYSNQIVPRDWVIRGNSITSPGDRVPFFTPASASQIATLTADSNTYRHPSGRGFRTANDASSLWFEEWRALAGKGGQLLDAGSTLGATAPESPRRTALGNIELQQFSGLGGNGPAADPFQNITLDRSYLTNRPRQALYLPWTESPPQGIEQKAGQVVRGVLHVPVTGVYRFWIAAEGRAEFRLNTSGSTPAGAFPVCSVGPNTNTELRAYDLAAGQCSDALNPSGMTLTAGQNYYFEIRHMGASDFSKTWSLAWQTPVADATSGLSRQPVPASAITPYVTTSGNVQDSGVTREYWYGIPSNASGALQVADLLAFPDYPNRPHGISSPSFAESPQRISTGYGQRIRGLIVPPVSGQYKFWIAGAFRGEFWISSDGSPSNLRSQPICKALGSTYRIWNSRADQNSSGQSPAIPASWLTLTAGQSYYFEIRNTAHDASDHVEIAWARPDAGGPSASLPDEVIPATALLPSPAVPASPAALQISAPGSAAFALTWTDASANERGFRVERRIGAGSWVTVASLPPGSTAFTDSALASGTSYSYRVVAWNIHGDSAPSSEVSGNTSGSPTPPAAPASFSATANSSSSVSLTWADATSNELGFYLERKSGAGSFASLAAPPANSTSHTDSGLAGGTSYTYRLRVLTPNGYSAYTPAATATPPLPAAAPSAPSAVTATVVSPNQINLAWTDNSSNETGFVIQRKIGTGSWNDFASVPADTTTLEMTGLTGNTQYTFQVKAVNGVGSSVNAASQAVTTQANPIPDPPSALFAAPSGSTSATLTWQDNSPNETGFIVEKSLNFGLTWSSAGANAGAVSGTGDPVTYTVTGLIAAATYEFRVKATNANGASVATKAVVVTTWPSGSLQVPASADSYIERYDGDGHGADNNNGTYWLLFDGFNPDGSGLHNKIYLKFSLAGFSGTASSATLDIVNIGIPNGGSRTFFVYGINDGQDGWSETGITWNNAPANAPGQAMNSGQAVLIGTLTVPADARAGTRISLSGGNGSALVNFLNARGADQTVTLALVGTTNSTPMHGFYSRDNGTTQVINEGVAYQSSAPRLLVQTAATVPAAPSGLTGMPVGSGRLDLSWTNNASDALSFVVERKTGAGGTYAVVSTVDGTTTSLTNERLVAGTTYFYHVKAVNNTGSSAWSNEISYTAAVPPVLAYEGFSYTTNSILANSSGTAGANGGSGWAEGWKSFNSTTTRVNATPGSASFSKSGAVVSTADNQAVLSNTIAHRLLDCSVSGPLSAFRDANGRIGADGTTIWISVLYTDNNAVTNDFGILLAERRGGSPTAPTMGFQGGRVDSLNTNLGLTTVTTGTSTGNSFASNVTTAQGVTRLLVFKVAYASGTDTVTMYADPDPRGSSPLNAATVLTRTTPDASFDTIQLRAGSQGSILFDEIRVGASYAAVVPTIPPAATGLSATPSGLGTIELAWADPQGWQTGYRVERSAASGSGFTPLATLNGATRYYTDSGLPGSTTYFYRVVALGPDGEGAASAEASSTTASIAPVLTRITLSPSSANVSLGATQQFAAVAFDQFDVPLSVQPAFTWTLASGNGSVSLSGLYSSPLTGSGSATVQAQSGAVQGTATITYSPTAIQSWRQTYFGSSANSGNAADSADPDGDGLPNLVEYALGGNPGSALSAPAPVLGVTGNSYLTLSFMRSRSDVTYIIQGSNNLSSPWSDLATNPGTTGQGVTFTDSINVSSNPKRFLRLKIIHP